MTISDSNRWFLHNKKLNKQYKELSETDALKVVHSIDPAEISYWLVWHEGWDEWKPLNECELFTAINNEQVLSEDDEEFTFEKSTHSDVSVVDFNEKSGVGIEIDEENDMEITRTSFDSQVINLGDEEEDNLREFERYHKKFKVRIENEVGQVFETYTRDISAGGAQLVAPLPSWVVGYCVLKLTKIETQETVELTCSIVEDQSPRLRYRIAISPMPEKRQASFVRWLAA